MNNTIPVKIMTQEKINNLFRGRECIFLKAYGINDDNYTITDEIVGRGGGGKSIIYKTCNERNCDYVAKVENKNLNFENETSCQIKASLLGISPKIYEIWYCKGKTVFIMDKLEGKTLEEYLSTQNDLEKKRKMIRKALQTLHLLHQNGILHGDVHSGNFIVEENEDIYVIDFGDAKDFGKDLTNTLWANTDIQTLLNDIQKTFHLHATMLLKNIQFDSPKRSTPKQLTPIPKKLTPKRSTPKQLTPKQVTPKESSKQTPKSLAYIFKKIKEELLLDDNTTINDKVKSYTYLTSDQQRQLIDKLTKSM